MGASFAHADTPLHDGSRRDAVDGRFDPWLLALALALAVFGVIMVASSSSAIAENLGHGTLYFLQRHMLFLALGMLLAGIIMRTELKTILRFDHALLVACFVLLLLVFIPGLGRSVNGARRWLDLGPANFQVIEVVKVMYLVWLASYLVRFRDAVSANWKALFKPIGVAVVLVGLLLMQPDFGSAMMLLTVTMGMLVLGGGHLKRMALPILALLPLLTLLVMFEPYRLRRITSFWNPWQDQLGDGYQLTNALMAIGRGEWFGVGLGASVQKLSYLPEAHTDFIFSILAEELGFVGVCAIIFLFAALVARTLWLGLKCVEMRRHFSGFCAFGVALSLGLQSVLSMGVNLGLLPTKGLTLPLISVGGSSVIATCMALGLVLRISYELTRTQRRQALSPSTAGDAAAGSTP